MAFYRDREGAIWIDGIRRRDEPAPIYCISDPTMPDDEPEIGLAMHRDEMAAQFGPLVEVRPTGWEEV